MIQRRETVGRQQIKQNYKQKRLSITSTTNHSNLN